MRKTLSFLAPIAMLAAVFAPASAFAQPGGTTALSGDTPTFVPSAQNLGAADPTQTIDITVWLNLKNEKGLEQQALAITTPGNASYHKFLSPAQVQATYDPSAQSVNAVEHYLQAKGFTVLSVAPNNYYVKVQGTIGQAEKAFHIAINNYQYHGRTYRSNASDPQIDNASGVSGQIAAITGLDNASDFAPLGQARGAANGETGGPAFYNSPCGLNNSMKLPLQGGGSTTVNGFIPCGYGAQQLETAYGVNKICSVRATGYSGTCGQGQTIVITDAYGSSSLQQDVNAYDQQNGLPPLTLGQNLTEVTPSGIANMPENRAQDPLGWQIEVTLDVENAHAIAPGANIVLVASPNNYADLDEALNEVVVHHYGNIVSSSWATTEELGNPARFTRDQRILETGTLEGIGFNFASGDYGDYSSFFGGTYSSVQFPASSQFATAVGGTSLFLKSDNSYLGESGWGTNLNKSYACTAYTTAPSGQQTCTAFNFVNIPFGFQGGAGGGVSRLFPAPAWQTAAGVPSASLAGSYGVTTAYRAVPDISMLADPYTGSTIYVTDHSAGATSPIPETWGGTSLATPLFSAIMALVDQERAAQGKGPAGLASQYVYSLLGTGALHDVNGVPSVAANGLYYQGSVSGSIYQVLFNQDSSLTTGPGWDDVTGVGSPNGQSFISAVANQ